MGKFPSRPQNDPQNDSQNLKELIRQNPSISRKQIAASDERISN